MRKYNLLKLMPLFFVITIDSMGLGILFPILSDLLISHHSSFMSQGTTDFARELWYGIIIGLYMFAWFFGSAILGDLSDRLGRKKTLMISLAGAGLGYVLSAIAIVLHSLGFLIFGRLVAGFTAGSQPVAQAAIIDISADDMRAKNIGYVLLAVSIGFLLGPVIGGVLSDQRLVSWFNYAVPLFFAGFLSITNCFLLHFSFKETFTRINGVDIRFYRAVEVFKEAFESHRIKVLSIVLLIETIGWSAYYMFVAQFLLRRFHYSTQEISFFLTLLALGFTIGYAFLVNPASRYFDLKKCVVANLGVASLLCLLTALTSNVVLVWVSTIFIGMVVSVLYSLLITLFSNQVNSDEQGWVMGVTSSVGALSYGLTSFMSGFMANFGAGMPIFLAFIGLGAAGVILHFSDLSQAAAVSSECNPEPFAGG